MGKSRSLEEINAQFAEVKAAIKEQIANEREELQRKICIDDDRDAVERARDKLERLGEVRFLYNMYVQTQDERDQWRTAEDNKTIQEMEWMKREWEYRIGLVELLKLRQKDISENLEHRKKKRANRKRLLLKKEQKWSALEKAYFYRMRKNR